MRRARELAGVLAAAAMCAVAAALPASVPAAVFLGKIQGPALVQGLLLQAAWAAVLVVLARLLFRRGLRQYSAYGG